VPRGYPRQEVPVGSGDVSGMCLTTDIPTQAYQPRIDRSVQECIPSGIWIGYAMGLRSKIRYFRFKGAQPWEFVFRCRRFRNSSASRGHETRRSRYTF
jgi:hypothetical protein